MLKLEINNRSWDVPDFQADEMLVWVLRDTLGLAGTRYGCGVGICGTCNVLIDGTPTRSCQTSTAQAVGKKITTLEGLVKGTGENLELHPVQAAFLENPLQCCWCMSGHIMNAVALLEKNPNPNAQEIDTAMNENYCRCGGYNSIRKNVARAAEIAGGRS